MALTHGCKTFELKKHSHYLYHYDKYTIDMLHNSFCAAQQMLASQCTDDTRSALLE
jgi:hypothetical protein